MNIYEHLCRYDPRNPNYSEPIDTEDFFNEPRTDCSCDNCFYGRDALAVKVLELEATVTRLAEALEAILCLRGSGDSLIDARVIAREALAACKEKKS